MPKLALKIDCMNTDSKVRPGTMKATEADTLHARHARPSADPNTTK